MNDFIYHYLSASLYLFAISVVIVENDLENKIIHVMSLSNTLCTKIFFLLPPNYLKIVPYIIYWKTRRITQGYKLVIYSNYIDKIY
jgi:hypothetical protein